LSATIFSETARVASSIRAILLRSLSREDFLSLCSAAGRLPPVVVVMRPFPQRSRQRRACKCQRGPYVAAARMTTHRPDMNGEMSAGPTGSGRRLCRDPVWQRHQQPPEIRLADHPGGFRCGDPDQLALALL